MKEEKKVNNKKVVAKKNTTKAAPKKSTTAKTAVKKAAPVKKASAPKQSTKQAPAKKKVENNQVKPKVEEKKKTVSKVNLEPKTTKVQENVEFPENKFSKEEVKPKKTEDTVIFTKTEKENIDDVIKELKNDKNLASREPQMVRSVARKNAITIISVLMLSITLLTIGYVITDRRNVKKDEKKQAEKLTTLNTNVYDKIVQNSKERDERLNNTKPDEKDKNSEILDSADYSNIITIDLAEFEEKVLNHENMIVLISSSTCYYCITYEPIINEELNKLDKTIYRLNVTNLTSEESNALTGYYNFTKTPTLFHLNDEGVVDDELIGSKGSEELAEWLENK